MSGASNVQTHVFSVRRSQSFSYGSPRLGAPDLKISFLFWPCLIPWSVAKESSLPTQQLGFNVPSISYKHIGNAERLTVMPINSFRRYFFQEFQGRCATGKSDRPISRRSLAFNFRIADHLRGDMIRHERVLRPCRARYVNNGQNHTARSVKHC